MVFLCLSGNKLYFTHPSIFRKFTYMKGDLLVESVTHSVLSDKPVGKMGERNALLAERDRLMVNRLYYYASFWQLRTDACIDRLSTEFFLSPNTVYERIRLMDDYRAEIKSAQPTLKDLAARYPWVIWSMPRY